MNGIERLISTVRARRRLPGPAARRLLRARAGLTQEEIAEALGVTRAAISRWETGNRNPRGPMLESYLVVLERLAVEETQI